MARRISREKRGKRTDFLSRRSWYLARNDRQESHLSPVALPARCSFPRSSFQSCFHKIPQSGTLKSKPPSSPQTKVVPHCRCALFMWGSSRGQKPFPSQGCFASASPRSRGWRGVGAPASPRLPQRSLPARPRLRVLTVPWR